jgi:F-type H+-transporting ATPase subunit epsilon
MWCSAASPTSCRRPARLLAESAIAVADIDKDDLARRIQAAREDVDDAKDDDARTKAESYLAQLTTLEGVIATGA